MNRYYRIPRIHLFRKGKKLYASRYLFIDKEMNPRDKHIVRTIMTNNDRPSSKHKN